MIFIYMPVVFITVVQEWTHILLSVSLSDLQLDYSLTDDFCKNHFLVGLMLREVGGAMQEFKDIRQIAVQVLKNLMIKHAFDDRYTSKVNERCCVYCIVCYFGMSMCANTTVNLLNIKCMFCMFYRVSRLAWLRCICLCSVCCWKTSTGSTLQMCFLWPTRLTL